MRTLAVPSLIAALAAALGATAPASAGELFGGLYVHDVKTPLNLSGIEGGADVMAGYRFGAIGTTPIQPYAFAALNTAGETNYAAIGLSAKFGGQIYIRPGLGLAVHDGSADKFSRRDKIAFGSRVLFEPELGVGIQLNDRLSAEASYIHMSHGTLFSRQNPGIDNIGFRLNLKL